MRRGGSASPPSPALPIGLQARARIGSAPQSSKGARTAPQEKQGPSTEKGGRPSQQKAELRILGDPVIAGTCSFPPFLLIWGTLVSPCSFPHKSVPCHAYRRTNTPLNKPIVGKTPEERWGGRGEEKRCYRHILASRGSANPPGDSKNLEPHRLERPCCCHARTDGTGRAHTPW